MKKYFYTNGIDKIGPFSIEELKMENLTRETKVWFYGLENWIPLSEVEELKSINNAIPPKLKVKSSAKSEKHQKSNLVNSATTSKRKKSKGKNKKILVFIVLVVVLFIGYISIKNYQENELYNKIVESSYNTNENFNFYIEKFYRDIGVYGIFPKKPKITIIRFAELDKISHATHYHGVSYGIYDDDLIEIYINPFTWKEFNKPMRYYLMYHELAHDVLNLDDLDASATNEGRLMYPGLYSYNDKTMDDFIESSHTLFEEISMDY